MMKSTCCCAALALFTCCSVFGNRDRSGSGNATQPVQHKSAGALAVQTPVPSPGATLSGATPSAEEPLQKTLIMEGPGAGIDGVELGPGRNDGVIRMYGSAIFDGIGYEWSFQNGAWTTTKTYSGLGVSSTPRLGNLDGQGNALYTGIWNVGVATVGFHDGWGKPEMIPGTSGKKRVLAVKPADGRGDGSQRLYVGTDRGLFEYTRRGSNYEPLKLLDHAVGDFGLGDGRNDGVRRIYAGERDGSQLHELSWDGQQFRDQVIYTCPETSEYSAHVADGRSDGKNRVYAWCGKLIELTYANGHWTVLTVDEERALRFYIRSGRVRSDQRSRLYVSQKPTGLKEYGWNPDQQRFEVDVVTGATGGCAIGDGRGDHKNRLYVARGSSAKFAEAAVVEFAASNPPPATAKP